ncbi:MAG: hypothetical protein HYY38_04745, partial [Rhodospirillales bacterium]|nr:hypothetical protein [Rhodospirillales bacterium]
DGSESLGVTVTGVPDGATLSAGSDLGGGAWALGAGDLEGLTMTVPEDYGDDFQFQLQATASALDTDPDSGATDTASTTVPVTVAYATGEPGDDVLSGGAGDDTLIGGAGTGDSFVFQAGGGHDVIDDYRAGETLRFEGPEFSPDNVSIVQDGSDTRIMFTDQPDVSVTVNDVDSTRGYQITPDPDTQTLVVTFRDSA